MREVAMMRALDIGVYSGYRLRERKICLRIILQKKTQSVFIQISFSFFLFAPRILVQILYVCEMFSAVSVSYVT